MIIVAGGLFVVAHKWINQSININKTQCCIFSSPTYGVCILIEFRDILLIEFKIPDSLSLILLIYYINRIDYWLKESNHSI